MILWLLGFLVLAAAAAAIGWPAYRSRQARQVRDLNTERYLAWRGRSRAGGATGRSASDDVAASRERRQLTVAVVLGVVALICLAAFFATGG